MAGEFLFTIGMSSQLEEAIQGRFIKGRHEARVVFVGRSNVGKSSLINTLLGARLAQVSKEPGKTKALHFYFDCDSELIFSDMPGYGFAKAKPEDQKRWSNLINEYLKYDQHNIARALILLDARHGPTKIDLEAIEYLQMGRIPVTFIMTKEDALKNQKEKSARQKEVKEALEKIGYDFKDVFWVSSDQNHRGIKNLKSFLEKLKRNA